MIVWAWVDRKSKKKLNTHPIKEKAQNKDQVIFCMTRLASRRVLKWAFIVQSSLKYSVNAHKWFAASSVCNQWDSTEHQSCQDARSLCHRAPLTKKLSMRWEKSRKEQQLTPGAASFCLWWRFRLLVSWISKNRNQNQNRCWCCE